MKKAYIRAVLGSCALVVIGIFGWFIGSRPEASKDSERLLVVATFFPLADWARTVGFDEVLVMQVVPDGVEPHDYEPSPRDVEQFLSADVILINGGGVDAWAEDLIPDAEAAGAIVVRMSDIVPFIVVNEDEHEEEGEEDEHGNEGNLDPHAWLDSARAQEMVRAIAEAFMLKDKANIATYATNADNFRAQLKELERTFSETLASCEKNTILVAHDAFQYWELRYGINIESITGISPEAEPSIQDLARITQEAKDLGITTIFFESPTSTAVATTLANEIGASVDILYPLEGRTNEQIVSRATYTDIMEQNLSALSRALSCTTP